MGARASAGHHTARRAPRASLPPGGGRAGGAAFDGAPCGGAFDGGRSPAPAARDGRVARAPGRNSPGADGRSPSGALAVGGPDGAPGRLLVVATPIGNLGDVSPRAREALAGAGAVAAEDTRRARSLLAALGLPAPARLIACRAESEGRAAARVLDVLASGRDVALVSDAGTPAVSDPGARVVAAAAAAGFEAAAVPGPCAAAAAVSLAGFGGRGFALLGFAPARRPRLVRLLASGAGLPGPLVLFESPRRLARLPGAVEEALGARACVLALEMTKLHEACLRGPPEALARAIEALPPAPGGGPPRGEATLVVAPAPRGGGGAPGAPGAEEDEDDEGDGGP